MFSCSRHLFSRRHDSTLQGLPQPRTDNTRGRNFRRLVSVSQRDGPCGWRGAMHRLPSRYSFGSPTVCIPSKALVALGPIDAGHTLSNKQVPPVCLVDSRPHCKTSTSQNTTHTPLPFMLMMQLCNLQMRMMPLSCHLLVQVLTSLARWQSHPS